MHHTVQHVIFQVEAKITDNEASITIKMVENIDCGEYRLKLYNDCGAAYADFTVKLLGKSFIFFIHSLYTYFIVHHFSLFCLFNLCHFTQVETF